MAQCIVFISKFFLNNFVNLQIYFLAKFDWTVMSTKKMWRVLNDFMGFGFFV